MIESFKYSDRLAFYCVIVRVNRVCDCPMSVGKKVDSIYIT